MLHNKIRAQANEAKGVIYQACCTSNGCSTNIGVGNQLLNDAVLTGDFEGDERL
jgi:hypothetical protein